MLDWILDLWTWVVGGEEAEPDPSLSLGGVIIADG